MNNAKKIIEAAQRVQATEAEHRKALAALAAVCGGAVYAAAVKTPLAKARIARSVPPVAAVPAAKRGRKPAVDGPSLASRVADALSTEMQSPDEIATQLSADVGAVRGSLAALVKAGRADKPERGRFTQPRPKLSNGHGLPHFDHSAPAG